jgi:hypothetical protein
MNDESFPYLTAAEAKAVTQTADGLDTLLNDILDHVAYYASDGEYTLDYELRDEVSELELKELVDFLVSVLGYQITVSRGTGVWRTLKISWRFA